MNAIDYIRNNAPQTAYKTMSAKKLNELRKQAWSEINDLHEKMKHAEKIHCSVLADRYYSEAEMMMTWLGNLRSYAAINRI